MDLSAPPTPWQPLLTRDEVEHHSPARKLGVTLSKEIWAKIGLFDLIKRAGAQLNVGGDMRTPFAKRERRLRTTKMSCSTGACMRGVTV